MKYPGIVIKVGSKDGKSVRALQKQLKLKGCGLLKVDGDFGPETLAAVKLFQIRFPDVEGKPLIADGKVGVHTWSALFGMDTVPASLSNEVSSGLLQAVLEVAAAEIGVEEEPPGSNRGKKVDEYISVTGLNPKGAYPWCACFVYWCFLKASAKVGQMNPVIKTAGVVDHWNKAKANDVAVITMKQAVENPGRVRPGQIFCYSAGSGKGHTGIVESMAGGFLTTIEGNTNGGGSREGTGVFRRTSRKVNSINLGFIDYGKKV